MTYSSENTWIGRIKIFFFKLLAPGIKYFRTQSINKLKIIKMMFEPLIFKLQKYASKELVQSYTWRESTEVSARRVFILLLI